MVSASIVGKIRRMQAALLVLSGLELNLWPRQSEVPDGSRFDYVIVGAGTAGCVLANRLTENKDISVLLIEAGDDPHYESLFPGFTNYLFNTEMDYNYTAEWDCVTNRCHNSPRFPLHVGKTLGGSSSIASLVYYQGTKQDYRRWYEASNDTTWLWENVLPYYKKTEKLNPMDINKYTKRFHGTEGYLGLAFNRKQNVNKYLEAFKDIGYDILPDINGDRYIGHAKALSAVGEDKFRTTAAYAYLMAIIKRPNLYLLKNTLVTKIIIRNKIAVGVKALTDTGTIKLFAKNEVIVAGGAIKSPQLLMLSGIGPKTQLEEKGIKVVADLPVGENLQDHAAVAIVHKTEKLNRPPPRFNPLGDGSGIIIGSAALNKSAKYPVYQSVEYIFDNLENMIEKCAIFFDYKYEICDQFYNKSSGHELMFTIVLDLYRKSRGRVVLRSLDPTDSPKVFTGLFTKKPDLENSVKFVEDFLKIEESEYFKSVGAERIDPDYCKCSRYKPRSKAYWKCYNLCMTVSLGHYCGTCSMGSVVDGRLFVIGVKRLRVVDASVIPFITAGAPYPPTIVVAEKAADMIKQTWE